MGKKNICTQTKDSDKQPFKNPSTQHMKYWRKKRIPDAGVEHIFNLEKKEKYSQKASCQDTQSLNTPKKDHWGRRELSTLTNMGGRGKRGIKPAGPRKKLYRLPLKGRILGNKTRIRGT